MRRSPKRILKWLAFLAIVLPFVTEAKFEPYELNGGLVCAVAGKDFCVIASDTRMIGAGGYLLSSRNTLTNRLWSVKKSELMNNIERSLRENNNNILEDGTNLPKHHNLPEAPVMIGTAGCNADCAALQRVIQADLRAASHLGQTTARPDQIASLLSQTLYSRRNFPYYSFCCLAGVDDINGGTVYVYDAVGSYEQVSTAVVGTGKETLQPILDRSFKSLYESRWVDCSITDTIKILVKAYRSVSEREIGVGDKLVLHVSEKNEGGGVDCQVLIFPLKQH